MSKSLNQIAGLRVPDGWELHPMERSLRHALLSTPAPMQLMATLDFEARGIRSGYSVTGRFIDEKMTRLGTYKRKKYERRGWRQALVDDAVTHLRGALR